jgi:hypothetical protein
MDSARRLAARGKFGNASNPHPDERSEVLGWSSAFCNYLADVAWRFQERRLDRFGLIVPGGGLSSWRTSSRASHAIPAM